MDAKNSEQQGAINAFFARLSLNTDTGTVIVTVPVISVDMDIEVEFEKVENWSEDELMEEDAAARDMRIKVEIQFRIVSLQKRT